jgi:hypothetical protein
MDLGIRGAWIVRQTARAQLGGADEIIVVFAPAAIEAMALACHGDEMTEVLGV